MARHLTPLQDTLDAGELSSLVGTPIFDNADQGDPSLTADEWAALLTRRRQVGWPLHFAGGALAQVKHA